MIGRDESYRKPTKMACVTMYDGYSNNVKEIWRKSETPREAFHFLRRFF